MIALTLKGKISNIKESLTGTISKDIFVDGKIIYLTSNSPIEGHPKAIIIDHTINAEEYLHSNIPIIYSVKNATINTDDIVAIHANGIINLLFRINSPHNSLFITYRCNSNCLMCSEPPRNKDDLNFFYELNYNLIDYIPKNTECLGITGGEPTILADRFIKLIEKLNHELPTTEIHCLTNGRTFAWKEFTSKLYGVNNRVMYGIPLYSDIPSEHDYIVQAKNAFHQTILGFHNAARYNLRTELRVVLHKATYNRLPELAKFIHKNLPFLEHIAFMGLEYTGYTPYNHDKLWMEPAEYMNELSEAVHYLDSFGMNVSIYNLQLCLLPKDLWRYSKKSISDWKRGYVKECTKCILLDQCGGIFETSRLLSGSIKAFY
jgi:His-Xaa-Ser system radical SAM maturase HxsC